MVAQFAQGSKHDFSRDSIVPRFDPADPDWLMASGTTLGADNGIGVASALSILEDGSLPHGPLECLFTTNEEDGMSGARALEPNALEGAILLNLDGEDGGELTIGCAGTLRTVSEISFEASAATASTAWFGIDVMGLLGGHSGVDIDKGRANASLLLARLLSSVGEGFRIGSIAGGTAANAIPREARALVGIPAARAGIARAALECEAAAISKELVGRDPGFAIHLEERLAPSVSIGEAESSHLLEALRAIPNGLLEMEKDMPDLVRSSSNLGELGTVERGDRIIVKALVMVRSSSDSEKERIAREVEAAFEALGASPVRPAVSPAWTPDIASPLLALSKSVYRELFGVEPKVTSTHGGLECGVFRPRFPAWDMISLGPTIRYPHSPDERVDISSVGRYYRFLKELIERL